jgi:hypothetical protein
MLAHLTDIGILELIFTGLWREQMQFVFWKSGSKLSLHCQCMQTLTPQLRQQTLYFVNLTTYIPSEHRLHKIGVLSVGF